MILAGLSRTFFAGLAALLSGVNVVPTLLAERVSAAAKWCEARASRPTGNPRQPQGP